MNQRQALRKAIKIWGKKAYVEYNPKHKLSCKVGFIFLGFFEVKGQGKTFNLAFQDYYSKLQP